MNLLAGNLEACANAFVDTNYGGEVVSAVIRKTGLDLRLARETVKLAYCGHYVCRPLVESCYGRAIDWIDVVKKIEAGQDLP